MQWIERIDRADGRLVPVYIDTDGNRTTGSLCTSRSLLPPSGYNTATVEGATFQSMKEADTREYLDGIGFAHADPAGHQVFALPLDGRRALIPAAVLLWALIGRISTVGDRLFDAASLDRLAVPVVVDGTLQVRFTRKAQLTKKAGALPKLQARFTWLTCHASARRMWDSVYAHAVEGRLGLLTPDATFNASLIGHRGAETVFVTGMAMRSLTPTEPPLPFAAPYVCGPFNFQRLARAVDPLEVFRAKVRAGDLHPCCKRQDDIPRGDAGWATSADEWQFILKELKVAGFRSRVSAKDNIDRALKKFATGRPWSSLGPDWRCVEELYENWQKRGQWELLKRLLVDLRGKEAT